MSPFRNRQKQPNILKRVFGSVLLNRRRPEKESTQIVVTTEPFDQHSHESGVLSVDDGRNPGTRRTVIVDTKTAVFAQSRDATLGTVSLSTLETSVSSGISTYDTPPDSDVAIPKDFDSAQTTARYEAAVQKLKSAIKRREDHWSGFDLGFDWGPMEDVMTLRSEIEKIMDARAKSSQRKPLWSKSKAVMEQIFVALSPFALNVLGISTLASNVQSPKTAL